jgi:hypothetical protein
MSASPYKHFLTYGLVLGGLLLLAAVIIPIVGQTSSSSPMSPDRVNLRQIMQASLIYANDHQGQLPHAKDVWDYAKLLAEGGGLESAIQWLSPTDPATPSQADRNIDVLEGPRDGTPRQVNPAFRKLAPCWAVALGRLNVSMRPTTPIAWTRGLQPDGTWAAHSPYGSDGGYIVFIGGNVGFYRDLKSGDELARFDGTGMTSNILESLPPGTRIGEYQPTPEEQSAWSRTNRWGQRIKTLHDHTPQIGFAMLWAGFIGVSIYRLRKRIPGALTILLWPLAITIILALLIPTVAS